MVVGLDQAGLQGAGYCGVRRAAGHAEQAAAHDTVTQVPVLRSVSHSLQPSYTLHYPYIHARDTRTRGSVAEWLACWTQAQKGLGSNRIRDAVLGKLFTPIVPLFTKQRNW